LKVLYYKEPKSVAGGVYNVAHYLPKVLAKKVDLAYFPYFMPKSYVVNLLNLYAKFVRKEFDIVHFNTVPACIDGSLMLLKFAKRRGTHTVLNIHDIVPLEHKLEPEQGPISYLGWSNILSSCKIVDIVVVNSEYMRNNVVTWYGISSDKIVVIPNGVDLRRFSTCDHKLRLEGDPAILYLGQLMRRKGVDVLFQAIAKLQSKLPRMKLHLVGSGYIEDFQLLAKKIGIEKNVVFHGWVASSMIPCYYKSADFCVFPSRHEGFGIVILEAMASGIPIIASDIGSFREITCNGSSALLFKPGDTAALSKAILALYQDLDLRKKISETALKTVMKYSWENIAERYVSLYRHLCQ
jgi:glycosyltransferase involved in cell wall biosynthesis